MKKEKRKQCKKFIKAFNKYNKGKSPKGLNLYQFNKKGKNIQIIDNLELIYD